MHKPYSVPENLTDKILRDFERETYHPIPARITDVALINKK